MPASAHNVGTPSKAIRESLAGQHPELDGVVAEGSLPELGLPRSWPSTFDGIVCSAVVMHLPKDDLPEAMFRLHELLAPGGHLLLSLPAARPGIVDGRDAVGRLFSGIRATELEVIAERIGFEILSSWEARADRQGREGYSWDALLLGKSRFPTGS